MKKLALVLVCFLVLTSCAQKELIGGQRDEHGCLGPAGYTWNEDIGACVREWELDDGQRTAAQIAVAPLSVKPITVAEVKQMKCPGCYEVVLSNDQKKFSININDWKII